VFESLSGDSTQLRATISELIRQLGDRVMGSIIVLATKRDRACDEELPLRLREIRTIMDDLGIGSNLVIWQSKNTDDDAFNEQLQLLNAAIEATEPVATDGLQQLTVRIQERAQQLCDAQVPEKWTKTEHVVQQYTEAVTYREEYEDVEQRLVTRSHLTKDWEDGGAGYVIPVSIVTAGLFPLAQSLRTDARLEKVTKTKHRDAVRHEPRIRVVPVEVKMERRKEVKDFVRQARQEIIEEIRVEVRK